MKIKHMKNDPFYDQYKTPEQREFLLGFKGANETEEEFWANVPNGAWLINPEPPTAEDIEWGKRVIAKYNKK